MEKQNELPFVAKLRSNGPTDFLEVSIPKSVREAGNLSDGDYAKFTVVKIQNGCNVDA